MKDNLLKPNERLDDLLINNKHIIQNKCEYCFTSDAVLLANFVKIKPQEVAIDFCSGSGVVGILASQKNKYKKIYLLEAQEHFCDMANRSLILNALQNTIEVINSKVQNATSVFGKESVKVVMANPPYSTKESLKTDKDSINMCKYETCLTLSELCASASSILKFGGRFYLIHKADRVAEIINNLQKNNLEPKRIQFVHPKASLNSNVVLIEAVKCVKSGVIVLPPKILN